MEKKLRLQSGMFIMGTEAFKLAQHDIPSAFMLKFSITR